LSPVAGISVAGSTVLLTGASSGIGRSLAQELARRDARLVLAARREALLEELADDITALGKARPTIVVTDLSQRHAARELSRAAQHALGRVDILINNAGGGVGGTQWQVGDRDEAREAFEVNLWSPLALTAALVPAMRMAGRGAVVNVTSFGQVATVWQMGHYTASKAAFGQATEALRMELHGSGVHVLEVIPGPVDTAVQGETREIKGADEMLRLAPMGDPRKLAALIVSAIERGRRRLVYPRPLRLLYAVPAIARLNAKVSVRRLAHLIDADDPRVIRTGSQGDDVAREARERWEVSRGRAQS
jgi:uncharacterized protein